MKGKFNQQKGIIRIHDEIPNKVRQLKVKGIASRAYIILKDGDGDYIRPDAQTIRQLTPGQEVTLISETFEFGHCLKPAKT